MLTRKKMHNAEIYSYRSWRFAGMAGDSIIGTHAAQLEHKIRKQPKAPVSKRTPKTTSKTTEIALLNILPA